MFESQLTNKAATKIHFLYCFHKNTAKFTFFKKYLLTKAVTLANKAYFCIDAAFGIVIVPIRCIINTANCINVLSSSHQPPNSAQMKFLKSAGVVLCALLATIYLINPTAGLFELIPDNIPFIGNLDEAAATAILLSALRYFGFDWSNMFHRETPVAKPADPIHIPPKY